jgi:glucose-6-phosphate 1-dehydrogenase
MGAVIKSSAEQMSGEQVELMVTHQSSPEELQAYEVLLGDAMNGDTFRFARMDYVDEAWRIVDPILDGDTPVYEYDPGTWGPEQANALVGPDGWHNPSTSQ